MEHVVLPVFYDVSPSVVLEQSGIYAEAFAKSERDPVNAINVPKWRDAMATAANLAGIDAQNIRLEAQLVEEIVNDVHRKLIAISSYGPSLGTFGSNGCGSKLVSSWINSENSGLNSKANSSCRGVRNADPASLSQIPRLHDLQGQGQQKFQTPLAHQQFQGRQPSSAHVQHAMGQGQLSQGNQLSRLVSQLSSLANNASFNAAQGARNTQMIPNMSTTMSTRPLVPRVQSRLTGNNPQKSHAPQLLNDQKKQKDLGISGLRNSEANSSCRAVRNGGLASSGRSLRSS